MAKTKRRKGKKRQGGRRTASAPGATPTLSLCVIARDEAAFLERCLRSVDGLVDEIVVLDTGSTDTTPEVARRHGARVAATQWTGDFADARNRCLGRARGRWVLILDCDEVLAPSDHDAVRALVTGNGGADAYRITTRNYIDQADRAGWVACDGRYAEQEGNHRGWFPTTKVRLWRNRPTYRFRGAVHELVEASILEAGGCIDDCTVPVHHYGLVDKERAADRYVVAGERKVAEAPGDLRARYELAIAYRDAGRLDEALREITTAVAGIGEPGAAASAATHLYLDESHVHLVHGDVLDRLGRLDEALAVVQRLATRDQDCHQAHNNAGSLLTRLGRHEEAQAAYTTAARLAPENQVIADNLARLQRHPQARAQVPAPVAAPRPGHTMSVCMIVRDGGADLDRCLRSVAAAADEIVVVDTGSTDDSLAIAGRHGARIGHFDWCDDFAAARNASLAMATGAWILWLDADDYLTPDDLGRLQRAKALAPDTALSFTLVNTGGDDRTSFRQVKMFPNRPQIRFVRPVHETVLPALEAAGVPLRTTDVRVMHTGYADAQIVARKKERYRGLMETWLEAHPDDHDICFRLGHTAYAAGDRQRAQGYFERVLAAGDAVRPPSLRRHAALFCGRCRLETGDWQASITDFELALQIDADDVFANISLGDALAKAGRHEDAILSLRRGLAGHLDGNFPLDVELVQYTGWFFLGQCLSVLGRLDEAVEAMEAAIALRPDRTEAAQALRQLRPSRAATPPAAGSVVHAPLPEPVHEDARLTLCMIVRDEEQRLGTCLESARGVVDEIVVVDTGSTDGTVEVARSFGATLGSFTWCDDFSAARNESLKLATGDWILWLDADDVLPAECHDTIRRLVAGPRDRGYFFVLDDHGYESVSCLQLRLFPNVPGVAFQMPIHEQLTPSLARLGINMVPTDVRVVHTGYTTPEVVREKKSRYLRIMEGWLQEHAGDYIVRSHVALTYHTTGRLEEAAEHYRLIIEESDCRKDHNYVVLTTSLLFLGRTYQKMGDLEQAWRWIREAEKVDADYVLTQFSMAEVGLELGRAADAVTYARKVLERDAEQLTFFPIDQQELRYAALSVLGRAQGQLGDRVAATQSLRQAAATPVARRSEALGQLSEIHKEAGDADAAMAALVEALSLAPGHPRHLFNAGMLHLEAGRHEEAEARFGEVLTAVGEESGEVRARALLNLGFIAKSRGDIDTAEARYTEVLAADPDHVDARANLAHLYLAASRFDEAAACFEAVRAARSGLLDIDLGLLTARLAQDYWDGELARQVLLAVPETAAVTPPGALDRTIASEAFLQLGAALVRGQLTKCAQMAFSVAVTCDGPASPDARRCLGELFLTTGRFWEAVAEYEALLRQNPTDGDAFRRLGDCYSRLGVEDAARMCYQRSAGLTAD